MFCIFGAAPCSFRKLRRSSYSNTYRSFNHSTFSTTHTQFAQSLHVAADDGLQPAFSLHATTRRGILSLGITSLVGSSIADELAAAKRVDPSKQPLSSTVIDYSKSGPFQPVRLPRLEHICSECFPRCLGDQCLLRIDVTYPKGVGNIGYDGPYPLTVFTSGYLVGCDAYQSYAERLASWGYTVILYDKIESVADTLNDEVSARMITDIVDWCQVSPLMRQIADTSRVYLVGHSRGGKISSLAAVSDPRVAALCLIDPVDTTVYAPLAPGFPSAVSALQQLPHQRSLPIAVVGSGVAGDCVPKYSNYSRFFESVRSPAWEVVIQDSGHFSFLDHQSALQRAICPQGNVSELDVRNVSQTIMVAWAEAMVRTGVIPDTSSTPALSSDVSTSMASRPGTAAGAAVEDVHSAAGTQAKHKQTQDALPGTRNSRSVGRSQAAFVDGSGLKQGLDGYSSGVGSTEGTQAQDLKSWSAGCLSIEIDRRALSGSRGGAAGTQLPFREEQSPVNNRDSTQEQLSSSSSSSFNTTVAAVGAGAETGKISLKSRGESEGGVSAGRSVGKVNSLSDWSEMGVNKMRDVSWQRYRLFTNEPATTRKELEGILTRLQYQTLLSLSSRFKNFENA